MTDKKGPNPHEDQEIPKMKRGRKLPFNHWIEKFDINLSKLADESGITRQQVHRLIKRECTATLPVALSIYYISGGLVDMFSLMRDDEGEILQRNLNNFITLTHSLNRSKISKGNKLTRYHLRRL